MEVEVRLTVVYKWPTSTLDTADIGKILNLPLKTVIARDLNGKNTSKNNSRTNLTGISFECYLDTITKSTVTVPDTPTHYPDNSNHTSDVLDIAILKIGSLRYHLEILPIELCDHTPILLDILMQQHQIPLPKSLRMVNWAQFEEGTKVNTRINANVKNIA